MKEEDRRIEEIIGQLSCPKNFKCAASGFKNLCKAKDTGIDTHLFCDDSGRSYFLPIVKSKEEDN